MLQLIFYLSLASITVTTAQRDCAPLTCEGLQPGDYISNKVDCTSYRVCLAGLTVSESILNCDANEIFNATSGQCERNNGNDYCNPLCPPVSCQQECVEDLKPIPNPDSCNSYIILCKSQSLPEPCPDENPYFDAYYGNCTSNKLACCSDDKAYCNQEFTEIPDPYDPKCWYLCMSVGIPGDDDQYCCEGDNQVYKDGICVELTTTGTSTTTTPSTTIIFSGTSPITTTPSTTTSSSIPPSTTTPTTIPPTTTTSSSIPPSTTTSSTTTVGGITNPRTTTVGGITNPRTTTVITKH